MVGKGVVVGLDVGLNDEVAENTGVTLGGWVVSDGVRLRINTSVWVNGNEGLGSAITGVEVAVRWLISGSELNKPQERISSENMR
jgi:hypothetical protein